MSGKRSRGARSEALGLLVGLAALLAPAGAGAQEVDLAVESVDVRPASAVPGQAIDIIATIRRLDPLGRPSPPTVDADVQFFVGATLVETERIRLEPGKPQQARARWIALAGAHAVRVRVGPPMLKGMPLKEANVGNNERAGPRLTVAMSLAPDAKPDAGRTPPLSDKATLFRPDATPVRPVTPIPIPPADRARAKADSARIAGALTVPPDLAARYQVVLEGPLGLRRVVEASGTGDRRSYRIEGLAAGEYRLRAEALAAAGAAAAPGGAWTPVSHALRLDSGETETADFRFEAATGGLSAGRGASPGGFGTLATSTRITTEALVATGARLAPAAPLAAVRITTEALAATGAGHTAAPALAAVRITTEALTATGVGAR